MLEDVGLPMKLDAELHLKVLLCKDAKVLWILS